MDIRTKLAVALVSVAILSMAVLGYFSYQASSNLLQDISKRQLDALAESKSIDVQKVLESWHDSVSLVASRTQLRLNLSKYNFAPEADLLDGISRIVADAQGSSSNVVALALYDVRGNRLVYSGTEALINAVGRDIPDTTEYLGLSEINSQKFVRFSAPLRLDKEKIGSIEIAFTTTELETVTGDFTGLGEYGETIILSRAPHGKIRPIGALRHAEEEKHFNTDANDFVQAAIAGKNSIFTNNQFSYTGKKVWAATRFIPEVNWGLIVQADELEELSPVITFRDSLIDLGMALSAFAIFGGTLLGMYLARPVRKLAEVVKRVRLGETNLRADQDSEDEVGLVARAFNEFLDQENNQQAARHKHEND